MSNNKPAVFPWWLVVVAGAVPAALLICGGGLAVILFVRNRQAPEASLKIMPLNVYKATTGEDRVYVRGVCEISHDYWSDYRNAKETHLSIRLRDFTGTSIQIYVERGSEDGKKLTGVLSDGMEHEATFEVSPGVVDRYVGGVVRIINLR